MVACINRLVVRIVTRKALADPMKGPRHKSSFTLREQAAINRMDLLLDRTRDSSIDWAHHGSRVTTSQSFAPLFQRKHSEGVAILASKGMRTAWGLFLPKRG